MAVQDKINNSGGGRTNGRADESKNIENHGEGRSLLGPANIKIKVFFLLLKSTSTHRKGLFLSSPMFCPVSPFLLLLLLCQMCQMTSLDSVTKSNRSLCRMSSKVSEFPRITKLSQRLIEFVSERLLLEGTHWDIQLLQIRLKSLDFLFNHNIQWQCLKAL